MKNDLHYYKNRLFPGGQDRYQVALANKVVGIGWSNIGSQRGKTKDEIVQALDQSEYKFKNKHSLSLTAGYFLRLLTMKVGDRILIPYNNEVVTIAKVTGPYRFDQKLAESYGLGHVVDIEVLKTVPVSLLSRSLKGSVGTILTISDLSQYSEEIESLIKQTPVSNEVSVKSFETETFMNGDGHQSIVLTLGSNITNQVLKSFIDQVIASRKNS